MTDKDDKIQRLSEKNPEDSRLWAKITQDIVPLKGKKTADLAIKKPKAEHAAPSNTKKVRRDQIPKALKSIQSAELDHRTAERLRKGQMPIEGRLDLHSMTRENAYDALLSFIPNCHARGLRCVLVITGKGARGPLEPEEGILKKMTPEWLSSTPLAKFVLRTQISKQKDGGSGAFYVLLRRKRE